MTRTEKQGSQIIDFVWYGVKYGKESNTSYHKTQDG
jgi:hypothetical protein